CCRKGQGNRDGQCWDCPTRLHTPCPAVRPNQTFKKCCLVPFETCCDGKCCNAEDGETCCGGVCCAPGKRCCTYNTRAGEVNTCIDPAIQTCCPDQVCPITATATLPDGTVIGGIWECCGGEGRLCCEPPNQCKTNPNTMTKYCGRP